MIHTDCGSASLLADLFQHHAEESGLTRKALQQAARVSSSTADRWFRGETEPTFSQVCDLIERLPGTVARDLLGELCGARFTFDPVDAGCLDRNGDGRIDGEDALDCAIGACEDAQGVLLGAREVQTGHHDRDREALYAAAGRLREAAGAVLGIAAQMRVRRMAKRPRSKGLNHESGVD